MLRFCARLVSGNNIRVRLIQSKALLHLSESVKDTTMEYSFGRPRDKNNVPE